MTSTADRLDLRYGRVRSRRSRVVAVIIAAFLAAVIAVIGWSIIAAQFDSVNGTATGFTVTDEHTITISLRITGPAGRPVACALEAQDPDHGVVGWRVVAYPAADEVTRMFEETLPTLAEATTGLVKSCWVP